MEIDFTGRRFSQTNYGVYDRKNKKQTEQWRDVVKWLNELDESSALNEVKSRVKHHEFEVRCDSNNVFEVYNTFKEDLVIKCYDEQEAMKLSSLLNKYYDEICYLDYHNTSLRVRLNEANRTINDLWD